MKITDEFRFSWQVERENIMINWISCNEKLPEKIYKQYLVTIENTKGKRETLVMTFEEKGRKNIPTWCYNHAISDRKVLYWAELPEPCQD